MERKEILVSDLFNEFEPKDIIGMEGDRTKWYSMPYENERFKGTFVSSMLSRPQDTISYDPKLCGWYKIYIAFPGMGSCRTFIKLTNDQRYTVFSTVDPFSFEEMYWTCADLTDQKITLKIGSTLASLRFVPMSDDEIAAYKAELAQRETKKLYIADDMYHSYVGSKNINDWLTSLDHYKDSDTEWFSPECPYNCLDDDFDEFHLELRKAFVNRAHELGMKVAHSIRMGLWGLGFPHVLKGAGEQFTDSHPNCHCVDRNGDVIGAMSYAYPEVRKHIIDILIRAAKTGGEAVTLLSCRGVPYVLFEKPVADRFFEKYGEYPYEYALDDPKLRSVHCEIMEDFFQELRDALDNEFGKNKIEIHLRGLNSIEDMARIGFDIKSLAKKGLLNVVMSHPRRFVEYVPQEILKDCPEPRIDIEKYNDFIRHNTSFEMHYSEDRLYQSIQTCFGTPVGPTSFEECVMEWEAFSKEYNIPVYHELSNFKGDENTLRRNITKFHDLGVSRFTLFNAVCTAIDKPAWSLIGRACHKDQIKDPTLTPTGYTKLRVHTVGDCYYNRFIPIWGG